MSEYTRYIINVGISRNVSCTVIYTIVDLPSIQEMFFVDCSC